MAAQQSLGGFAPPMNPALSQWHTPQPLANRMAAWCVKPNMRVLEPCAGGGNIVRAILGAGGRVTAIEIDPAWATALRHEFGEVDVITDDFFKIAAPVYDTERFDLVLMNSPYEDGQDALWIERALDFAPRVVALVPSRILFGVSKYERLWSKHTLLRLANQIRRPVFAGSGGKFDLCVVDVQRGLSGVSTQVEWWS